MVAKPPQPEERDRDLPTLDALIQILGVFQATCIFPPAQVAIYSINALLAVIRVPSLRLCHHELPVDICLGYQGQQTRFCRAREFLRSNLSNSQPRAGWETIGRTRPFRA